METRTLVYQSDYQAAWVRRHYMAAVWGWIALALVITGGITDWVSASELWTDAVERNRELFIALFVVELFLVFGVTVWVDRMSLPLAVMTFVGYAVLNGLTLSALFYLFTHQSVARVFYITAATFGFCGVYGFLTAKDMSRMGNILGLAWWGVLMATGVNLFMQSGWLYWIISYVGVMVTVCVTASDVRRIKVMAERAAIDRQSCVKSGIYGGLMLYLDFVNMVLFFLRIFGGRRQDF